MHSPKWAHRPTSGAGAAKHGGRLNRPGAEALYLAQELGTAAAEYQQGSPLLPPGTLVTYEVALSQVADFRNGFDPKPWPPIWEDFACDWRKLVPDGIKPPTWVMFDHVVAAGWKGVLLLRQRAPKGDEPCRLHHPVEHRRRADGLRPE